MNLYIYINAGWVIKIYYTLYYYYFIYLFLTFIWHIPRVNWTINPGTQDKTLEHSLLQYFLNKKLGYIENNLYVWDTNIINCVFKFIPYGWQRLRFSRGLWDFSAEHFFVKLPKPCVWWQKHVVLETMREMERECCPLWKGMCPLTQVTMLNSVWAPGKKTCHSEIPGDALCEPFIISLSHVCLLAYSRLTNRPGVVDEAPLFESNESHPLIVICRVA